MGVEVKGKQQTEREIGSSNWFFKQRRLREYSEPKCEAREGIRDVKTRKASVNAKHLSMFPICCSSRDGMGKSLPRSHRNSETEQRQGPRSLWFLPPCGADTGKEVL